MGRTEAVAVIGSAGQIITSEPPPLNGLMARLQHENKAWLDIAMAVLHQACLDDEVITTDAIWPLVTWPTSKSGGRLIGKVVREALQRGWMIKMIMADGHLDCLDHIDLPKVHTIDGVLIRHQSPVVVYRSLLVEFPSGFVIKDSGEPAHAARGSGQ